MAVVRLPVSERLVSLRRPGGREDLMLAEADAVDVTLAVALLDAVARPAPATRDGPLDWWRLPITDVDAALLMLRRVALGERVVATVRCRAEGCRARVDVAFRVSDYLAHHAPAVADGVRPAGDEPGWFVLSGAPDDAAGAVSFRLPTAADQLAIAAATDPAAELAARCVRPAAAADDERVQAAMESMAPSLAGELHGACAECGAELAVELDPLQFTLRELRERAGSIFDEIHLLAARYGWSEDDILAMSHERRARYAELILAERGG